MHTRGRAVAVGLLVAATAAAAVLHWLAGFSFPLPWVDEAHFLAPARSLIARGTLAAPQIGAADGIFWMPDGYSVLVAPIAGSVAAVRAFSLLAAVAFAACLLVAVDRAGGGVAWVGAAAAAWLVAPRVVLLSNVARMEAPVLALAGVALLLVGRRRWGAAAAVAALAPLLHPVGVVVLGAVAACAAWFRDGSPGRWGRWGRWDWVLLLAVGIAWVAEVAWFAWHAELASEHLAFQLQRKAGRPPSLPWTRAVLLTAAIAGTLVAARRRRDTAAHQPVAAACLLMAAGFVLVTAVGNELWYEVLGGATAGLLVAAGAALLLPGRHPGTPRPVMGPRRLPAAGTVLAGGAGMALAAAGITATLTTPLYGMTPDSTQTGEWRRFTADAVVALDRLDRRLDEPATVVVHRLSGIGPWLYGRRWRHLRVVQPTPVTPVPAADSDYALATLDRRALTRAVIKGELPAGEPIVDLRSDQGSFDLRVYQGPFLGP
ncbi:MAG: hypothetical protein M3415_09355 [Actinomycetota bacterium]|nr:hypothetical protein [Actinomycetota bacterium]